MPPEMETHASFPELMYPSSRKFVIQDSYHWLKGKRMDDGAEDLWRVHDKLYDFSSFIKNHPGGEYWLNISKGTDITESFESHHISEFPELMLGKFYVRDAKTKRNSPFTFKEDGFYRTLKRRAREALKDIPKIVSNASKMILDELTVTMFILAIASCHVEPLLLRAILCLATGVVMSWNIIAAHNFLHQKDNWRMYVFNFSFMNTQEWRVSHGLSHHQFPNTLFDMQINTYDPVFQWLPRSNKSFLSRYGPIFYSAIVYAFMFYFIFTVRVLLRIFKREASMMNFEDIVPFTTPLLMYVFGKERLFVVLSLWIVIVGVSSFVFYSIGFNAAHHHPDIFHDGDTPNEDRDWGVHQLSAVMDRVEIQGSLFRTLTNFGDHGLHHLFPSIDHACLPYLDEVLLKTCEEFKTELRMTTQWDLIVGNYKQMARIEPKITK